MLNKRFIEILVGMFMLAGIIALFVLAFKVSGLNMYSSKGSYHVSAIFDNIGDLKVRAPVTIAGVRVGEVSDIGINATTFKATVGFRVDKNQDKLPADTTAKILTAGIIGANYIELIPGYDEVNLKDGDVIIDTQPAIILENLISQMIYKIGGDKKESN
ncbi:MAG: outer membrane lipid asymmetry maintenance protein MlaD [Gammaproteobacteria bacterium]|nr:outer membrane lipid asymmetry maintenance protein MlaD [Gammaproteobacteria bacterium]